MKQLDTIALTSNQKRVIAKILAAPTPSVAGEEISGDQNLIAARNQLTRIGAIQVLGDEATLTDVGERLAREDNITDESGELTPDGQELAFTSSKGKSDKDNTQAPPTTPPPGVPGEELTMSHAPKYERLQFLREIINLYESEHQYSVGEKVETLVGGRWIPATITKPPHKETGNYGVRFVVGKKTMNYVSSPKQLRKAKN